MAMSIAFIPLSAIRTDDILSSLQQLFLDFSYHYTSKRAVYIQLKQSLLAKLAKNFKIIQGKLGKNGSSLISCYLHSKDMLLQLQPIVLWHWFVERFQVQHYLKRHSNLKKTIRTHTPSNFNEIRSFRPYLISFTPCMYICSAMFAKKPYCTVINISIYLQSINIVYIYMISIIV